MASIPSGRYSITDRYIVRSSGSKSPEALRQVLLECPGSHQLHSVVSVHGDQHGTAHFVVIFEPIRPL